MIETTDAQPTRRHFSALPERELDLMTGDFRRFQLRQEHSPNTVRIYEWALRDFCAFMADHGVTIGTELQRDLVEEWQDGRRRQWAQSSRSTASVAVRQFLRWGVGQGVIDPKAPYWVTHVKGGRGAPRPIPIEDVRQILAYLARHRFAGSLVDLRNRALFLYILATGPRVSEAMQVKRDEMHRSIVIQKGGADKDLEVPPIVLAALEEYLAERRDTQPWMWVTLDNNHPMRPMSAASVREVWRQLAERLHITPWTTHQLRHTGATELYKAGIDGLVIADWLGHKGMGHVGQYTRVSYKRRQEALTVLDTLIRDNSNPNAVPTLVRKQMDRTRTRRPARPTATEAHSVSADLSDDQKASIPAPDSWSDVAGAL
jgi:site-specific recombinase XerD